MKNWRNILGILFLFVAGSIGGQLGLEVARAAFWQWSTTPINNQTGDPSINWSEGQSPSSVNDSARAMMARLAEQGKDTSGQLVTAGGPTAFTVTTNQGFPTPTPQDGQVIGLTFNVNNAINPTLSVDAGTAYPILVQPGYGAPANTMVAGMPYTMKFNGATNSWLMRDGGNSLSTVPIGTILATTIPGNPADTNYIVAAGECVSTTTYAVYWALLGSPAPGACTAGQFAVIDLRGRVLAGTDVMGGSGSAGRLTASTQGCGVATTVIGSVCNTLESHTMALAEMVAHNHGAPMYDPAHYHVIPLGDPGHFHATATSDPGHYHAAAMADPQHAHSVAGGVYGSSSIAYMYYQGGAQGGPYAAITINANATGVYISGVAGGYTSSAGTGVTMSSGNGANTTGSKATGITMAGAGGNYSTNNATTGVRVNGAALDYTATVGSTTPFPVVQPTIVVNYIIRVL